MNLLQISCVKTSFVRNFSVRVPRPKIRPAFQDNTQIDLFPPIPKESPPLPQQKNGQTIPRNLNPSKYDVLKDNGFSILQQNNPLCIALVEAAQAGERNELFRLHQQLVDMKMSPPDRTHTRVLIDLIDNGNAYIAEKWYKKMGDMVWNDLIFLTIGIQIYSRLRDFPKCLALFEARKNFSHTNDVIYVVFFDACGYCERIDLIDPIMREILQKRVKLSTNLFTTLIEAHSRNSQLLTAYYYFNAMEFLCLPRTVKTGRTFLSFLTGSDPEMTPVKNSLDGLDENEVLSEDVVQKIKKRMERPDFAERFHSFMLGKFSV